jgi:bacteriorhodopsin
MYIMIISDEIIKQSFNIPYVLLMTTGAITFIEALRTNDDAIRHIMNIETCISIIAAYFYSNFVDMIKNNKLDHEKINIVRYTDWSMTTPLMILSLTLFLSYNIGTKNVNFKHFLLLIVFNYLMLLSGYLGEIGKINKKISLILGFLFFILLFYFIYVFYIKGYNNIANNIIYGLFLFVWTLYGVIANFEPKIKNITYNILDLIAKCFIGLGMWAYFTGIFKH